MIDFPKNGNSNAAPLALGCWAFGGGFGEQDDNQSLTAMQVSVDNGVVHFDTAMAYGGGRSEKLVGQFIADKRDQVFIATKGNTDKATGEAIRKTLDKSLENLGVDCIDLYYIHWPRAKQDMKPVLAAMEEARAAGKFKYLGVSNFGVDVMEHVKDVAKIDANQICYNLYWRYPEADVIPYCIENDIAVVTYSSIAQGILSGKFGEQRPTFPQGDNRNNGLLFDEQVWPHLYPATEKMKALAAEVGQPLVNLAIQWVARQPGVASVLLGARNETQARENAAAVANPVSDDVIAQLTTISDEAIKHVPDVGNIFRYYPE